MDDPSNELCVSDGYEGADDGKVRMLRMQAGQWVHLHEVGDASRIRPKIDSSRIPAPQAIPRRQGRCLRHLCYIVGHKPILHQVLAILLIHV